MYDIKIPVCACVKKTVIKEVENWVQFREEKADQSLISISLFIADYPHT